MSQKFEKPEGKEHLDKDFLAELKHKIWSTKGTRFAADDRLKSLSKISGICIGVLSVYLIIFGLLSVYNLYRPDQSADNLFAFSLTATSILLLLFSTFENSQDYKVKAKSFHDCALDLADLYNELQNFKAYRAGATDEEKLAFCDLLQKRYQDILRRYENHSPIDNQIFKANHMDYYKYLKWHYKYKVQAIYFCKTKLLYYVAMAVPGIILIKLINS